MLSVEECTVRLALGRLVECTPFKVLCWCDIHVHNLCVVHRMNVTKVIGYLWSEDLRFLPSVSKSRVVSHTCIWVLAEKVL